MDKFDIYISELIQSKYPDETKEQQIFEKIHSQVEEQSPFDFQKNMSDLFDQVFKSFEQFNTI